MSVALLFSPQGSQAVGMGRELAEVSAAARAVFNEADATLGWSVQRDVLGRTRGSAQRHAPDAALPPGRLGGRAAGA